jgi:tRNA(Ser,Leu) C12 N-acetylase TAN1
MLEEWNVVATSIEGHEKALLSAMKLLGEFEPSPYHNVIVGRVEDRDEFMDELRHRMAVDEGLAHSLGRALPVETTATIALNDPVESLAEAITALADRIGEQSYHVRVEARGVRGLIHAQELEKQLGDLLWYELLRRNYVPTVDFHDPDLVVAVEMIGHEAGVALVGRYARRRYPFFRVR